MIDKNSLLKSQGSLYLEFIPKDGRLHKMLLLSLIAFKLVDVPLMQISTEGQQIRIKLSNRCNITNKV